MHRITTPEGFPMLTALFWFAAMAIILVTRPLMPVDETRYLAVAWEMWRDGQFLVPHLNGDTYSHKPPLLFWLMHLGWAVLGVNEWWPRLVAPLFALANLLLMLKVSRMLWPEAPERAWSASMVLQGCLFWTLFATLTMFDMILTFFTLAGMAGILKAWRSRTMSGFIALGVAIGFGVLAKGPAILLHVLPAALLAPWWGARLKGGPPGGSWGQWYAAIVGAVGFGCAIGLVWAVSAGIEGGEDYRNAIFWGQSAGRILDSFDHGRPWWWYAVVILPMTLPWALWPRLWRGLANLGRNLRNGGIRFCLAWFAPVFIAFSLISGKQLHYLLPIFPPLALVIAFAVENTEDRRLDLLPTGILSFVLGLAILAIPTLAGMLRLPAETDDLAIIWGVALAVWGVGLVFIPAEGRPRFISLAGTSLVFVIVVHLMAQPYLGARIDMKPLAKHLSVWEREGYVLGHYGKYHGQFHFLGRLERSLDSIGDGNIDAWLARTHMGKIITYQNEVPPAGKPDLIQPFRGKLITVWDADSVRHDPDLVKRPP